VFMVLVMLHWTPSMPSPPGRPPWPPAIVSI